MQKAKDSLTKKMLGNVLKTNSRLLKFDIEDILDFDRCLADGAQ